MEAHSEVAPLQADTLRGGDHEEGEDIIRNQSYFSEVDPNETISEDDDIELTSSKVSEPKLELGTKRTRKDKIYSSKKNEGYNQGRWTKREHSLFIEGLVKYGNNWKSVQKNILTRSSTQARSHAQKFFLTCKKEINSNHTKEENRTKIFQIFSRSLSHLIFKPNDDFYKNVETLIFASDKEESEEIISESNQGTKPKKKYRHHPHIRFDKSILQSQKEKIFEIKKCPRKKIKTNRHSTEPKFQAKRNNNLNQNFQQGKKMNQVINIVTINVMNNHQTQVQKTVQTQTSRKNSNPFDIVFDTNDFNSNVNNSNNIIHTNCSTNNLFEMDELNKNVEVKNQNANKLINIISPELNIQEEKEDNIDNFDFSVDMLFKN